MVLELLFRILFQSIDIVSSWSRKRQISTIIMILQGLKRIHITILNLHYTYHVYQASQ